MSLIQAVLFDYGLVLTGPPDPAARVEMQRLLDVTGESLQLAYWQHRDAYDRGTLTGVAYWNQVATDLHRVPDEPTLYALIAADTALWTQPNQPMIDWAAALQRSGIRTGILSNLGDEMETGIRQRLPWLNDFNHHTFSHHLGIAKPDQAIYLHAARGLETPPSNILFIDDKPENIHAASHAGMMAIQYTTTSAFTAEMNRLNLSSLLSLGSAHSQFQMGN